MSSMDRRNWLRAGKVGAVLMAGLAAGAWKAEAGGSSFPSDGRAYPSLEAQADPLVANLIKAKRYPGMSVAISKEGRLLLSKGYGQVHSGPKFMPWHEEDRARIGSVTKATITGPAAFQLMQEKGINPSTQRLYGPSGIFGSKYDADIRTGVKRHMPIVGLAISPEDKVHAWYSNGTFSVGATNNLDQYARPKPYSPGGSRKAADIVDCAIAKNGRVYTWYDNNSVSIGTPEDLDRFSAPSDGDVKLPAGKTMDDVVGIGIAKSDNHVYVWYDDATVSSGTSKDFDFYFKPKRYSFAPGSGGTSYNIRGAGISKEDRCYAWFINGKASSGTSTDLDRHLSPYPYTYAPSADTGGEDWEAWYRKITIQHLLDHRAGFTRSGDTEGAARMFGTNDALLTYDQVHRHFLRTRKLVYEPGKGSQYSNHGFGLWTLLIEEMSGKPYATYVRDDYLRPIGLQARITGEVVPPKSFDAWNHNFQNGKPVPFDFEKTRLGLAAGGFRASAGDLLLLTRRLDGKYSDAQLDSMGWGKGVRGKLEHNGKIDGGTAYVAMFPSGYTSAGGKNLSRVHVALITNVQTDPADLETLASRLALLVPDANVPASYDVWKGKPVQ